MFGINIPNVFIIWKFFSLRILYLMFNWIMIFIEFWLIFDAHRNLKNIGQHAHFFCNFYNMNTPISFNEFDDMQWFSFWTYECVTLKPVLKCRSARTNTIF